MKWNGWWKLLIWWWFNLKWSWAEIIELDLTKLWIIDLQMKLFWRKRKQDNLRWESKIKEGVIYCFYKFFPLLTFSRTLILGEFASTACLQKAKASCIIGKLISCQLFMLFPFFFGPLLMQCLKILQTFRNWHEDGKFFFFF